MTGQFCAHLVRIYPTFSFTLSLTHSQHPYPTNAKGPEQARGLDKPTGDMHPKVTH
jgi:hypothetical protein